MKQEENLQTAVSNYLKLQYPNVIFTAESSGVRLPIGLAKKAKEHRNPPRGLPDILILNPKFDSYKDYYGLFLELKTVNPYLKNGCLSKNKHIQEQAFVLERLNKLGYVALFSWSFEMSKKIIDSYMKGSILIGSVLFENCYQTI